MKFEYVSSEKFLYTFEEDIRYEVTIGKDSYGNHLYITCIIDIKNRPYVLNVQRPINTDGSVLWDSDEILFPREFIQYVDKALKNKCFW